MYAIILLTHFHAENEAQISVDWKKPEERIEWNITQWPNKLFQPVAEKKIPSLHALLSLSETR